MAKGWKHAALACVMVALPVSAAFSQDAAQATAATQQGLTAEEARLQQGMQMLQSGQVQAAIDGPLTDVIKGFEKQYGKSPDKVFSVRGTKQTLYYLAAFANGTIKGGPGQKNAITVGPEWATAYWLRGYAYSGMGRYAEATADLKKALVLSPKDAAYTGELAFVYQMEKRWNESLLTYQAMAADVELMDGFEPQQLNEMSCKALRGEGFALVEMKRYAESEKAYQDCIQLIPGEPKSTAELEYVRAEKAKAGG